MKHLIKFFKNKDQYTLLNIHTGLQTKQFFKGLNKTETKVLNSLKDYLFEQYRI